ncbi:MAG: YhfC family intramembrane metalloprotease [Oscillospiraceae bacterium]|nr:YhfC family intramembrane metalloprotease [Oscillospiraceae bacterium]
MISGMTLIGCIVSLFISLLLPVIAISIYSYQNKGGKMVSAWVLGAVGFVISQLVVRVSILSALQGMPWFTDFSENHAFLYTFSLAFTAGLFELAGRFVVAKLLAAKNLNYKRSLAAGLGHGGIEAMILVGITYLNNILYILMINNGTFDTVVNDALLAGTDVTAMLQVKDALISTSPALFFLGGFERILAMTGHVAMSMLVCYGIHIGKPLKCSLICLGIHTLMDLTAGINMLAGKGLSQTVAYVIIYGILTVMAALSLMIIRDIRRRWKESEVLHV